MSNKSRRALVAGKLGNLAMSVIDKNRAGWAGGKAMDIDPELLSSFSGIDPERVLFVSGTNGKSDVTAMIYHILRIRGYKVVSNVGGDDLIGGVASSLIKASSLSGRINADFYIFDVDENCVHLLTGKMPCGNILITNLQKGQQQRSGDPDTVRRKMERAVKSPGMKLIVNGDEPRACSLADSAEKAVFFSVSRHSKAFTGNQTFVTMPCPKCRRNVRFSYFNNGGIGEFCCEKCGYTNNGGNAADSTQTEADYMVTDVDFAQRTFRINGAEVPMKYDIPHLLYDYAAAIAACREIAGITEEQSISALESFSLTSGQTETVTYKGKSIKCMSFRQENPDTLQEVINSIAEDKNEKVLGVGLGSFDDTILPYLNTFSAFDCDYSALIESIVRKYIFFTETTAYDSANSFIYGGAEPFKVEVFPTDDEEEILQTMLLSGCENMYLITDTDRLERIRLFAQKGK